MAPLAFSAALPLSGSTALSGRAVTSRTPTSGTAVARMSADTFLSKSQTKEAKQAATPFGVYTVQCTEGTSSSNTAESTRLAALAASFRLRQSSQLARYADLFATRRAAVVAAAGSHVAESYAVRFPAFSAARVLGRAEAMRACSRYFGPAPAAEQYMFECVDRQYKATKVPYGTYTTACCDGRVSGDAETARVAGLAAAFRAGTMGTAEKMQMRYNASLDAMWQGRGCTFEEEQFAEFPKMASAMRYSTGAYAAQLGGVLAVMGGQLATVAEQIAGENLDSYWPSNAIRPAVERQRKPWDPSPIKDYAPMSAAAVAYGMKAQEEPFEGSVYDGWSAGWQPKTVCY